jgi:hypothetical protein
MTNDLAAFVAARLDEKERRPVDTPGDEVALCEVKAMRSILDLYAQTLAITQAGPGAICGRDYMDAQRELAPLRAAAEALAAIWSDHPDYRPEWKP